MNTSVNSKHCSKCKTVIICLSDDITHCECSQISLSNDTLAFLKCTNYNCLCNKCLIEMNEMVAKAQLYQFPTNRNEMIEGVHYYIENGYFVFTALYHLLRGKCCQSGCKHCVYGFKTY